MLCGSPTRWRLDSYNRGSDICLRLMDEITISVWSGHSQAKWLSLSQIFLPIFSER